MGEEPSKIQHRPEQSPASGEEQPRTPAGAGVGVQLCEEGDTTAPD